MADGVRWTAAKLTSGKGVWSWHDHDHDYSWGWFRRTNVGIAVASPRPRLRPGVSTSNVGATWPVSNNKLTHRLSNNSTVVTIRLYI